MTTPVSTILNNAKVLLNDAGLVHWTEAELLAWGSEAEIELVKVHPDALTKTVSSTLVAGARQTVPTGCIQIVDIRQNANGAAVTLCDRKSLDLFQPNWMTAPSASTVKHWMPDENPANYLVYPAQSGTPATLSITHSYLPSAALTALGNLTVRDIYAPNILNYVMFRAFSKDSEPASAERAVAYAKAFYG